MGDTNNTLTAWVIRDAHTGQNYSGVLYAKLRDANAKAERLNQKYGAVRYVAALTVVEES
jgi:hypothetical protein